MRCSPCQQDEELVGRGRNRRTPTAVSFSPTTKELPRSVTNGIEQFLVHLRSLLLRVRVANQLRQDVVVEKCFVELKDLCRSQVETTSEAFEGLWAIVGRRRGAVASTTTGRLFFLAAEQQLGRQRYLRFKASPSTFRHRPTFRAMPLRLW